MNMAKKLSTLAALVFGLTACDGLTLTGAKESEAEIVVELRGDGGAQQSQGGTEGEGSAPASSEQGKRTANGEIDASVRVYVQSSGGGWLELTRGVTRQAVDASGRKGARVIVTSGVRSERYHRVRLEFERVDVDLLGGVQIDGGLFSGVVRVEMGRDGKAVVEREVYIDASAGSTTRLEIDLNAATWLSQANAGARVVSEADFRSAVLVSTR
jgi:hypothetical protein